MFCHLFLQVIHSSFNDCGEDLRYRQTQNFDGDMFRWLDLLPSDINNRKNKHF